MLNPAERAEVTQRIRLKGAKPEKKFKSSDFFQSGREAFP